MNIHRPWVFAACAAALLSVVHIGDAAAATEAVVAESTAALLSAPNERATRIDSLHLGDRIRILTGHEGWVQVETVDRGERGWIPFEQAVLSDYWSKPARQALTRIAELGYGKGITFDNPDIQNAATLYFDLPRDSRLASASLRLNFVAGGLAKKDTTLRIDINDIPQTALVLRNGAAPQAFDIPLPPAELDKGVLKVQLRTSLANSENRCLDARTNSGFIHLTPDSGLALRYKAPLTSIRDFWNGLPGEVALSLPSRALSEQEFAAAWRLSDALLRKGKRIRYLTLPALGEVVLATQADIRGALQAHYFEGNPLPVAIEKQLEQGTAAQSNVALLTGHQQQFLWFSPPFPQPTPSPGTHQNLSDWMPLGSGTHLRVTSTADTADRAEDRYRVSLQDLGLDTSTRYTEELAEWRLALPAQKLRPGFLPELLQLEFVSSPTRDDDRILLYIYINDVLQQVSRLENKQAAQQLTFAIKGHALNPENNLRIVAQRERTTAVADADCFGTPSQFPIQLAPGSALVALRRQTDPTAISDLGQYMAEGYRTFITEKYRSQPAPALAFLARLSADLALPVSDTITFIDDTTELQPTDPFILIGMKNMAWKRAPIRFDQGNIQITDNRGQLLLDLAALPDVTIAQIVDGTRAQGLWVAAAGTAEHLKLHRLAISDDDLVFADASGVIFSLNSRGPDQTRVGYSDIVSWEILLSKYRWWLMTLAWLVLVAMLLYFYRMARQHNR